jgi:hypothetical protein
MDSEALSLYSVTQAWEIDPRGTVLRMVLKITDSSVRERL